MRVIIRSPIIHLNANVEGFNSSGYAYSYIYIYIYICLYISVSVSLSLSVCGIAVKVTHSVGNYQANRSRSSRLSSSGASSKH